MGSRLTLTDMSPTTFADRLKARLSELGLTGYNVIRKSGIDHALYYKTVKPTSTPLEGEKNG